MMRDLSMHVLDIAQNSIKAGASLVQITFAIDGESWMVISVKDNGCGMSEAFLAKVTDPFTTTRSTRRVGLGIPMLQQSAELSGGKLQIDSTQGIGTTLTASFHLAHIDCLPLGEMCDTLFSLVFLNPEGLDFVFEATSPGQSASFDTRKVREVVGEIALNEPEIAQWIKESIEEEFKPILEVCG